VTDAELQQFWREPLPASGDFAIVLDGAGAPRAIIETTSATVMPFDQIGEKHAAAEGEGDRTLEYWSSASSSASCTPADGRDFERHAVSRC